MSTRSAIIVQTGPGSFQGIYCHSDGYLSYNGAILWKHFHTLEKAKALVANGDLSSIKRDGTVHSYYAEGDSWDRVKPREADDWQEVARQIGHNDWVYVFCHNKNFHDGGEWFVRSGTLHFKDAHPLAIALQGDLDEDMGVLSKDDLISLGHTSLAEAHQH